MMINPALAQVDALTATQRAVRDHFQTGGSIAAGLLIVVGVLATVLSVHLLTRQLRRREQPVPFNDPKRLFRDLMQKLALSDDQRRLLDTMTAGLHLQHPATILMSPMLFDDCVTRWKPRVKDALGDAGLASQTRATLFPTVDG